MTAMGEVTEYVAGLHEPARSSIEGVFFIAREVVPEAEEGRSYGMPALLYRGKALIAVMRTKKHIGVYPFSGRVPEVVAGGLPPAQREQFEFDKGTIRFQPERPLPDDTVRAIVAARVAEIEDPSLRKR